MRRLRLFKRVSVLALVACLWCATVAWSAQVRLATYNIRKRSGGNALRRPRATGHFLSSEPFSASYSSPQCHGPCRAVQFLLPLLHSWYTRGALSL
jgi:hypothetical protein